MNMETLPEWWNDLIGWFVETEPPYLPPNMAHAWRVNRYADEVCNGGLPGYLTHADPEVSHQQLVQSVSAVCDSDHVEILEAALALLRSQAHSSLLPAEAQVAKAIAYDSIVRGWDRAESLKAIAEICPDCPSHLRPVAYAEAMRQKEEEAPWQDLEEKFYAAEPRMRLCIARFAEKYVDEWDTVH